MTAHVLVRVAAELALFSGVGFFIFALNDLAVDLIYFGRQLWRSATVYRRFPRAFAASLAASAADQRFIAIFIPAWDEAAVIGAMLKSTLARLDYANYRLFVGCYRNDPATTAAVKSISDPRVEMVVVEEDGPTTKADCLNHIYGIM
jgi:adsorption protein B